MPKVANKKEIEEIKSLLLDRYRDSKSELEYSNAYELLVAVMLSAQCTDKRVNMITPLLFQRYKSPKELADAKLDDVCDIIKSCSFFNNKAKNLISMAKSVVLNHNGEIPLIQKELVKLAGVGQKSANVLLIELLGANMMAVDTHVFRVSHRLGISSAKTATDTERELSKKLKDNLDRLHQAMVLFGRYICKSKQPDCQICFLESYCKSKKGFKPQ